VGKCRAEVGLKGEKPSTVIILGGSGGIGKQLVSLYATKTEFEIRATFHTNRPIEELGANWSAVNTNEPTELQEFLDSVVANSKISAIIDCTGDFYASLITDSPFESLANTIQTNLISPLYLSKLALDYLASDGTLIFLNSVVGQSSLKGSSAYAASKAGLEAAIRALAPEFSFQQKKIFGVRLGYIDGGMTNMLKPSSLERVVANIPNKRLGEVDELFHLVRFMASNECSYSNGAIFNMTGGL
jgi:3-oxoacyl-[acyl-carrier protein] reductase